MTWFSKDFTSNAMLCLNMQTDAKMPMQTDVGCQKHPLVVEMLQKKKKKTNKQANKLKPKSNLFQRLFSN